MRRGAFLLGTLLLTLAWASAQEQSEGGERRGLSFGFEGIRLYSFYPTGLDLSLAYAGLDFGLAGDTLLFLKLGGGYQEMAFPRDPATGEPQPASGLRVFDSPNAQWELAFIQGLSARADGDNLMEAFLFYRGRYDAYANSYPETVFTDMRGLFGTSFMAGLSIDSVEIDPHRAKRGLYAEATGEWGPGYLNAKTDFWRLSGQARVFLPIFDLPGGNANLLNMYAALYGGLDCAGGVEVPIYVNQSMGGRVLGPSLGGRVRGYGRTAYDSAFKAAASAELRLVGPALGLDSLLPVLFAFVDAGYFYGFSDAYYHAQDRGGLASAGAGLVVDLFGAAQLGAIAGFKLIEDRLYAVPDAFFWSLVFAFHY